MKTVTSADRGQCERTHMQGCGAQEAEMGRGVTKHPSPAGNQDQSAAVKRRTQRSRWRRRWRLWSRACRRTWGLVGWGCASKHTGVCQKERGAVRTQKLALHRGASQVALLVRNLPASAGELRNTGSIPGPGRSPGGGNGNAPQYSRLENPIDRGAWLATVHGVQLQLQGRAAPLPTLCSAGGWRVARVGCALWLARPCPEGWAQLLPGSGPLGSNSLPSGRLRGRTSPSCSQQTVKDVSPGHRLTRQATEENFQWQETHSLQNSAFNRQKSIIPKEQI